MLLSVTSDRLWVTESVMDTVIGKNMKGIGDNDQSEEVKISLASLPEEVRAIQTVIEYTRYFLLFTCFYFVMTRRTC